MRKILILVATTLILPGPAFAQQTGTGAATHPAASTDAADSLFRLGREAVADGDYRRAATLLRQVASKYPSARSAGDALYWQAWALYHEGLDRRTKTVLDEALASVDKLQTSYRGASTAGDAPSLRAQILAAQASLGDARAASDIATEARGLRQERACTGSRSDEETRLAALEGLLNMNADDAVPILKDVLKQRDPCRAELRKRALWLMSQKGGADVVTTMLDVARNDPSEDVRKEAVFWLSQTHAAQAVSALDSILVSATDNGMRKQALFALSQQTGDDRARQAIRGAAENEKMPLEVRKEAVFWLGQSGLADLDYFKTLFRRTSDVELRKQIVFAVSQTKLPQSGAWLLDVAGDKTVDVDVRKDAIFFAGQTGAADVPRLAAVYDQSKGDGAMQDQVLFVLSQRRESAAVDKLMDVAKSDASIERRKQALFWLGQKDDPRVKQFLRDLINK